MNIFERILSNVEWAIAGMIGALVAVPFHEDKTVQGRFWFVCSGIACSYFMTGFWTWAYKIPAELTGAIGFVLGAFGASFVSAVIKKIQTADLATIIETIKSKFGGSA